MNNHHHAWTMGQRLLLINGVMFVLLAAVAVAIWFMMSRISDDADSVRTVNVPQLQRISEMELNVTRVSLQLRHAILARNAQELEATLADIADKRKTIAGAMEGLGQGMFDDEGRQAFVPLQGLVNEFWKVGEENLRLIQDGKKDEAFAFLVDRAIPARNKILAVLDGEKKRQSQRLSLTINEVKSLAAADRNIAVAVMVLVVACLSGLGWYLRAVVRDLGADPPDLKRVALAVANGDLGVDVLTREGDKVSIMAGLRNMRERLAEVVGTVRQSAESVSTASREISAGNHDLSARTEQQAAALQQTAASMDEMGAAVRQNAESARRADQLAKEAARVAEQGGTVVSNVVNTMKGIHDSSNRISNIIGVIDSIAFQTNILALNAAVEAARASDQGRGFAVVAAEVRTLSQRTATAAKEIKELITVIDQGTQQNAALVEEMAAAASSLENQAAALVQTMAVFRMAGEALSQPKAMPAPAFAPAPAPAPARAPAVQRAPAPAVRHAPAASPKSAVAAPAKATASDDNWESF
ncbi:methyl-accepting chemotaxis protein [Acidovorax sp. IB03]|uniref:methyl-accepting chemotaxis protein n=1 Tax=Acidovorax sp. IB03 TaxID=2779366 RepID=UPI00271558D5|nr:methyl-accepting chemotaxis protein [Acidovorax sp. IB03]